MKKTILIFAALTLAILALLHFSKYSILSGGTSFEWIIAVIAIVFFFIGTYINKKSLSQRTEESNDINIERITQLQISDREYEVLRAIADGLSNKEIAAKLFLTESTIKTHVSNLLVKLNAKRRTQAVQIAKQEKIL
ncbi:MAG: response regulator transcription factor [bacterium]